MADVSSTIIRRVRVWVEHLDLTRPYTIAYKTLDAVENAFVVLETADGHIGIGAASPGPYVTGEDMPACKAALEQHAEALLLGKDIRHINALCREMDSRLAATPAALAALDIALHDLYAQHLKLPLVDLLGRAHHRMLTSITIGIKSVAESIEEAQEYMDRGFRIIKLKIGQDVEKDVEMVHRLREKVGNRMKIRVDANQGYSAAELIRFAKETEALEMELIEQPVKKETPLEMLDTPAPVRAMCAGDESMRRPEHALQLAAEPQPFGIYNIKLMKCGGVAPAMQIAGIAHLAGIELMWGCMDESIVSISAALHAALASPATRYLDLDGSLDLARDLVKGGFILQDGYLSANELPGLGVQLL